MSGELVREATPIGGGPMIAKLRCFDDEEGTFVEAEVMPVGGTEPIHRGPYRFATAHEAFKFMQEAMLAFEYLGCSVT